MFTFLSKLFNRNPKPPETLVESSLGLLRTFGLSDQEIDHAIKVIVQVNDVKDQSTGKTISGNQKAVLATDILSQETDWPIKAIEFMTMIVKLAWLIAKIIGKI